MYFEKVIKMMDVGVVVSAFINHLTHVELLFLTETELLVTLLQCLSMVYLTLVNVYVDLLVFTRIAGTS